MSEQIQNISDEILEYKNKFFFKIFSDFLRGKKAPGVPVSKAEVLAMDENNKKIFICDKDGNMIGKSITTTAFVTNNLKLIKELIK